MDQAHVGGDDGLVDVVDPETGLGTGERIRGKERFAVGGIGVFEELVDDEGFIEGLPFVFEGRNKALGVDV